jgi:hypothetical protein
VDKPPKIESRQFSLINKNDKNKSVVNSEKHGYWQNLCPLLFIAEELGILPAYIGRPCSHEFCMKNANTTRYRPNAGRKLFSEGNIITEVRVLRERGIGF